MSPTDTNSRIESATLPQSSMPLPRHTAARRAHWGPVLSDKGALYSVWAPERDGLQVRIEAADGSKRILDLTRHDDHFHQVLDPQGRAGDRYQFIVEGKALPDPASRAQAGSVHEASLLVDPTRFRWTDQSWCRPAFRDLVIYELHIGTFTPEGTFRAAIDRLPHLKALGVNAVELMPIADFPGTRSWGYDGVLIYAPARAYGTPDDLRALVDAAHAQGLAVILDVVYNHFGPDGNYVAQYSAHYSTPRHQTPWGAGFNVDGEFSDAVREFFLQNPIYWMEDFHIDGFRLDATHEIADESPRHILAELVGVIHQRAGYVIAEDPRNQADLLRDPVDGGMGFDAVWADDFHHIARVSQTGEREAYFQHFEGTAAELVDTLQNGWRYRGQPSITTGKPRGTECAELPPSKFLHCLSNHDQVGNRALGQRLSDSISPEAYRALSMLLCLTPYTPMLFMGQEWAASSPFLYFTHHKPELGRLISEGRRQEFAGFSAFRDPATLKSIPDPQAEETFLASKLNWAEANEAAKAQVLALYTECLHLRQRCRAFRPENRETWQVAQIGENAGAIRIGTVDRVFLLVFALKGKAEAYLSAGELTHPPANSAWRILLSSNDPRFGGPGEPAQVTLSDRLIFPTPATLLLEAVEA